MPEPVGATYPYVSGLSCTSDTFCIAVGSYLGALPDQPFAERWDGRIWSLAPLAQVAGPVDTELTSVSCTSPRACIAVGRHSTFPHQGTYQAFAERWDGARWSLQGTPIAPHESTALSSVSCTSGRACTAVGAIDDQRPLVERWDGTSWSFQRTHNGWGGSRTVLQAVSCTARAICTAVGNGGGGSAVAEQSAPAAQH